MAATVKITWSWITIEPSETWKYTKEKLLNVGVDLKMLPRSVYVIRLRDEFCISYPGGHSPTLYIGEGRFRSRITNHRKWLGHLYELTGPVPLEVGLCFPRVTNNTNAHRTFEAHLLNCFYQRYNSLPLKNSIHENMQYDHHY